MSEIIRKGVVRGLSGAVASQAEIDALVAHVEAAIAKRGDVGKPRAYACLVGRRWAIDRYRHEAARKRAAANAPVKALKAQVRATEAAIRVILLQELEVLLQLSEQSGKAKPHHIAVVRAAVIQGRPWPELVEQFGVSLDTLHQWKHRGLAVVKTRPCSAELRALLGEKAMNRKKKE
ncbi:MAG: hypothetical protein H0U59_04105 [Gemmatimonadaceae bacterium]|nr:hypothetical protein [Gemmatimonadaceae bacterium]